MNRRSREIWCLVLCAATLIPGCHPQQPFYCREDGDLSHYLDVATEIEYPDVEEPHLDEVNNTLPPLTLKNTENYEMWDLSLQEAIKITLCNSQVMRKLGGSAASLPNLNGQAVETISRNILSPVAVTTTYDPALIDTTTGLSVGSPFNGSGTEAALSEFDAQLDTSVFWEKNDRIQNRNNSDTVGGFSLAFPKQDIGTFGAGIRKTNATGGTMQIRNNTNYEGNNTPSGPGQFQAYQSAWTTNMEASFSQPLLQGAGVQYNRIAGPQSFDQYSAGLGNPIDGVIIARIRNDQSLADFEGGVRDLVQDVELNYWDLYFRYRNLEAQKMGRDSALATWKKTAALFKTSSRGGSADREAQARSQYFQFRAAVELALTDLYRTENRLRYLMGLSMSDGRLIRPSDEPTTARVAFDWTGIHCEALTRRVEIRKQKWEIKRRELELVAARNYLLPRLDAIGRYRWLGLGDDLLDGPGIHDGGPLVNGTSAFGTMTAGDFQEWQLGLQLSMPLGFRRELSGIRHQELLLARDRELMQDLELEISHQLGDSVRDLDLNYGLTQTNFNRRVAAEKEVQAVQASYDAGRIGVDLLLDAQRRRADAESEYYRSLISYNQAIMRVHYRKGSLLDYDGVYLAEGPWPAKAYFDALRQARKRDAGTYIDYGYTRPNVLSRGPIHQGGENCETGASPEAMSQGTIMESASPTPADALPQNEPLPPPAAREPAPTLPSGQSTGDYGPAMKDASTASAENAPVWQWAER